MKVIITNSAFKKTDVLGDTHIISIHNGFVSPLSYFDDRFDQISRKLNVIFTKLFQPSRLFQLRPSIWQFLIHTRVLRDGKKMSPGPKKVRKLLLSVSFFSRGGFLS